MAYFYRVAFAFFLLCSGAFAVAPASEEWQSIIVAPFNPIAGTALSACQQTAQLSIEYNQANNSSGLNPWALVDSGYIAPGTCWWSYTNRVEAKTGSWTVQRLSSTCPANSTPFGTGCGCTAPYVENAAKTACVLPPGPCAAGTPITSAIDTGWHRTSNLTSVYSAQSSAMETDGCTNVGGNGCTVRYTATNAPPIGVPGSNGYSFFTSFLNGATTGATCTPPAPSGRPPEPACAGQSGMVNGVSVCLPPESPAQRDARINDAARAAAAAASQSASNQGVSTARAAAAAAAAGDAARSCLQDPACTPADAIAAANAAAAASLAASAAPDTPASAAAAAGAAASIQDQITQRATSISSAANLNSAQTTATIEAARTAGMAAYNQALAMGGTQQAAENAARVAGQAATASSIYGATPAATAAAAAAAAAGATAGSAGGTPGASGTGAPRPPETPVDDFCKRNPQAKMCKNDFDSTFAGACGAPPVCTGDAVMCAIAAATHKQECNWRPGASTESAAYDAAKIKTGDQTGTLPGNSTVNVGPGSFNQTELLGTASGMLDRTITVMGKSIVIPFSDVNPWLQRLGMVFQAVTFLLCLRIVTRG